MAFSSSPARTVACVQCWSDRRAPMSHTSAPPSEVPPGGAEVCSSPHPLVPRCPAMTTDYLLGLWWVVIGRCHRGDYSTPETPIIVHGKGCTLQSLFLWYISIRQWEICLKVKSFLQYLAKIFSFIMDTLGCWWWYHCNNYKSYYPVHLIQLTSIYVISRYISLQNFVAGPLVCVAHIEWQHFCSVSVFISSSYNIKYFYRPKLKINPSMRFILSSLVTKIYTERRKFVV